eukprot:TRINITY_DN1450_c0_g1_i2.p2 TRINITY_DN1450_c0_g1~~TRINITY_DN1450_c0_g1_i2.p2  ORF type:complete len:251 (-),score=68.00 TRINITY_DN1450_c0_g1_i2:995-1747(-)
MEWLFGKRKTPEEVVKEHQRTINRAIRELERERTRLQQSEKKIIMDIKKSAKVGQMGAAKIMAKDLVRTRKHVEKMYKMKTQLQTVSLRLQTIKSQHAMASAMAGVTKAMMKMNRQLNLPAIQKIMMEFERQSEIMEMKEETIGDTMDDMMDDGEDEEAETDNVINQVLDEIGIDLNQELVDAPSQQAASAVASSAGPKKQMERVGAAGSGAPSTGSDAGPAGGSADAGGALDSADRDLQDRLDQLRKKD